MFTPPGTVSVAPLSGSSSPYGAPSSHVMFFQSAVAAALNIFDVYVPLVAFPLTKSSFISLAVKVLFQIATSSRVPLNQP